MSRIERRASAAHRAWLRARARAKARHHVRAHARKPSKAQAAKPNAVANGAISGYITDASTGNPVGGFCGIYAIGPDGSSTQAQTCSNADSGSYQIRGLAAGSYVVQFSDPNQNFVPTYYGGSTQESATEVSVSSGASVTGINVALQPGGTISGTITDAQTGQPVVNSCGIEVQNSDGSVDLQGLCTDQNGEYEADGLPTGSYTVDASFEGYVIAYYGGASAGDAAAVAVSAGSTTGNISFAVNEQASISGTITDAASGKPLANNCNIYVDATDESGENLDVGQNICTDANGGYTLEGIPPESAAVVISDQTDNYVTQWYDNASSFSTATPVAVKAGASVTGINFALVAGATIRGTITDAGTGNPVSNDCDLNIYAIGADGSYYYANTCTDSSGGYTIADGLPTGSYQVAVSDGDGVYATSYYDNASSISTATSVSATSPGSTGGIDFALAHAGVISGVVTDAASGQPLTSTGNCDFEVDAYTPGDSQDVVSSGECNDDGSYSIGQLPAGSYILEFVDYSGKYQNQYYNGSATFQGATQVAVSTGATTTTNIVASRSGAISGTVQDASGNPVSTVCVNVFAASDLNNSVDSDCTAADGTYEVDGLNSGSYVVEFVGSSGGPTYIPQYYNNRDSAQDADLVRVSEGSTSAGIDATMAVGASFSGTILDDSGNPVQDACVQVYQTDDDQYDSQIPEACTDSSGDYQTVGFAAGSYDLEVQAYGYVSQYYDGVTNPDDATPITLTPGESHTVDFALDRGATMSGTVKGTDTDSGVANISVCASGQQTYDYSCTDTSDDGSYTITGLLADSYTVYFSPDYSSSPYVSQYYDGQQNYADATAVSVDSDAAVTGIDATLQTGGQVTGTVTDASSDAAVPACESAYSQSGDYAAYSCNSDTGAYSLTLPAGTYTIEADPSGPSESVGSPYLSQSTNDVSVTTGSTTSDVDFALSQGATVSGEVTDAATGSPLSNICVSLDSQDGDSGQSVCTGSDGTYTSYGVAAGTYTVEFDNYRGRYITQYYDGASSMDDATPITLSGQQNMSGINAAMVLGGVVSGTVTDSATGSPLTNACVDLVTADGSFAGSGGCTDSNGNYQSAAVPAGTYYVEFSAPGYDTQYYAGSATLEGATPVSVTTGNTTSGISAALAAASLDISGTVTDSAGNPIADVCAYLYNTNGTYADQGACTDDTGSYDIQDVPAGDYDVAIYDPHGLHTTEWYGQSTDQDGATQVSTEQGSASDIDVQLAAVTSVTGTVTTKGTGAPVVGACVYLFNTNGTYAGYGSCTKSDGTYAIQGEPSGTYDVAFVDPGGTHVTQWYDGASTQSTGSPVTVQTNSLTTGIDAALQPITSVEGVVSDSATGLPVSGVCAYLYDNGGSYAGIGYCTNANGRYVLANMPAGDYNVAVYDPSAQYLTGWYPDATSQSKASKVAVSAGQLVTGDNVSVSKPGAISGYVQNAAGAKLANVCVYADASDGTYSGIGDCTDSSGQFTLSGLAAGSYKLGYYPTGEPTPTKYWYLDASSEASATTVSVSAGVTTQISTETVGS